MARFVMMTRPSAGHVAPAMPIAGRLVQRGHELVWITGTKYREMVENTGARFHPRPSAIDPGEKTLYDFYPPLKKLKGIAQVKWYIKHVFLDACALEIEAIETVLKDFPADILIGDSATFGVYFKSELGGPPSAAISLLPLGIPSCDTPPFGMGLVPKQNSIAKIRNQILNLIVHHVLLRDVSTYANGILNGLGLQPLNQPLLYAMPGKASLIMHISTPAFEYPRSDNPEHVRFIGPIVPPPDPTYKLPHWWPDLNHLEPIILVNQGTVATNMDNLVCPAMQGLADLDMLVIAVPVRREQLDEIPRNVRAEPFIPFGNLLPHVDVMVSNGGYGGTQAALAHGIPLVTAGATEDKMEVAARVEWSGTGINLRNNHPSPGEIREAVQEVISNPSYRANAKRVQSDFLKYDAPARAVQLLEAML